jgi:glutathione-regulated potassium-efflux system ancillary protein KefG
VYWYSIPPLLKQWIDMVLTYGWAYGKGAEALAGKYLMQVFSSGGTAEVYSKNGHNKRPLRHYMYCHEQTAALCKLNYLPPYVVHGTHKLSDLEIHLKANEYENLLRLLQCTDLKKTDFNSYMYINDWITK